MGGKLIATGAGAMGRVSKSVLRARFARNLKGAYSSSVNTAVKQGTVKGSSSASGIQEVVSTPKRLTTTKDAMSSVTVTPYDELRMMSKKYKLLNKEEAIAKNKVQLPDGRVRYYREETPASTVGSTRGAGMVTEYNPKTGIVRQWYESRDHSGKVVRVHPKNINAINIDENVPHYPYIFKDLQQLKGKK